MDKHSTSNYANEKDLRKWAENKNPFFAYLAILAIDSADTFHHLVKALHHADIHSQLSRSDVDKWLLRCKRRKKLIKYTINDLVPKYSPIPILEFKPLNILIRVIGSGKSNQKERIKKRLENIPDDYLEKMIPGFKDHVRTLLDDLIEDLISKNTPDLSQTENVLEHDELFLLNNHLMCLIEYNECFTLLYRKARLGDYESIKKLLRIDPILLKDRFINHHFITAKPLVSSELKEIYNKPLKYHTKASKVKVSICGFLSAFKEVTGGDIITPKELANLLNAYAVHICHKSEDEQLPDELEAFRKAVKRHHKLWLPIVLSLFNETA